MERYDVFICYRGNEGGVLAANIYSELCLYTNNKLKIFFAPRCVPHGSNFRDACLMTAGTVSLLIMILSPDFFAGCDQPDDIVYGELKNALKNASTRFLPILMPGFDFKDVDQPGIGSHGGEILHGLVALIGNHLVQLVKDYIKGKLPACVKGGYDFVDGKMTNLKTGEPLEFEILSNSANGTTFTRVMLPFIANLQKIGIKATFRNLEVNVFKNRMDNFDFDVAIMSYRMSSMPGNELKEMFGSQSADVKGSYNIMGIKNPVVDSLIDKIVTAQDKQHYEAYVKALDRVLLSEYYLMFQWYSKFNRVGYQNKFGIPQTDIKTGYQPFTWWSKEAEDK